MRSRGVLVLALAAISLAGVSAAGAGVGVGGGDPSPRIVDVSYVEELRDGKRHSLVVDVTGPNPIVFAVADGREYSGHLAENIHHGPRVQTFLIRNREFIAGLLDDLDDDRVAKVKVAAGNSGGVVRKKCRLELRSGGTRATGVCRNASF